MPKLTFIAHDGTRRDVEVPVGTTIMRAAVDNGVPGIDADCGGQCACATCHVYVEQNWLEKTGPQTESEQDMLSFAAITKPNSRLACQVAMTDTLDGLVVHTPEGQH
ncbi:MAG: 2Fe-2S iron-sulfur cluster-binding protein [Hyphomicrobiaceae bacterium]|nr:(2Fe-2S)-binding protein [Hyphomicrobiaceae bacterium]